MITYQVERMATCLEDIKPLLKDHWEEVALNKDVVALNPDFDMYQELENQNYLAIFTARDEGRLIGYFVVIANKNPHYKDHLFAANDVIYLVPEHRKTHVGSKLIEFATDSLKNIGVSVLAINTKRHIPFDSVLNRLGFEHTENLYTKYLGDK